MFDLKDNPTVQKLSKLKNKHNRTTTATHRFKVFCDIKERSTYSLEPGETPTKSAYHQALDYALMVGCYDEHSSVFPIIQF